MALTPIDVQQKTFATALRGYDLDEVDDFLDSVVIALKDYEQRLRDAQERIATLEGEMTNRGDSEGVIARALVAAQRSADSIVADARVEAEGILDEARAESVELSAERDARQAQLRTEVEQIRSRITALRTGVSELAGLIPAHLDAMDDLAISSTDAAEASGATFDASLPMTDYSIPDHGYGFEDPGPAGDEGGTREPAQESSEPAEEPGSDAPVDGGPANGEVEQIDSDDLGIGDLSARIDSAFEESADPSREEITSRPWET